MGGAALAAAAPYPGNCDLNFPQGAKKYNFFLFVNQTQTNAEIVTSGCLHGGGSLPKNPSKLSSTKAVMRLSPGVFWPSGVRGRGSHTHQAALHSLRREGEESILQLSDVQLWHPLHVTKINKHHLQLKTTKYILKNETTQPPEKKRRRKSKERKLKKRNKKQQLVCNWILTFHQPQRVT